MINEIILSVILFLSFQMVLSSLIFLSFMQVGHQFFGGEMLFIRKTPVYFTSFLISLNIITTIYLFKN